MEASDVSIPQSEVIKPIGEAPRSNLKAGAENLLNFLHIKRTEKELKPAEVLAEVRDEEDMKADSETSVFPEAPTEAPKDEAIETTDQTQTSEAPPPVSAETNITPDQAVAVVTEVKTNAASASKWHEMFMNNIKNPAVMSGLIVAGVGLANAVGVAPGGPELKMALDFVTRTIVSEGGVKSKLAKGLIGAGASDLVSEMVGSEVVGNVMDEAANRGKDMIRSSEKAEKVVNKGRSMIRSGRERMSIRPKKG